MSTRYTSERLYYVRGATDELAGNLPMDTGAARDVVNNLNHLQDMQLGFGAQCGVASGSYLEQSTVKNASDADPFAPIDKLPPMFLWLHQQQDGSSSRIVVRLVGYASAAGTVTFRIALRPFDRTGTRTGSPGTGDATSADVSTSSTTAVTLSAVIYVPRLTDAWTVELPTADAYTNTVSVRPYLAVVEVWAKSSATSAHPRVTMVTTRENMNAS